MYKCQSHVAGSPREKYIRIVCVCVYVYRCWVDAQCTDWASAGAVDNPMGWSANAWRARQTNGKSRGWSVADLIVSPRLRFFHGISTKIALMRRHGNRKFTKIICLREIQIHLALDLRGTRIPRFRFNLSASSAHTCADFSWCVSLKRCACQFLGHYN